MKKSIPTLILLAIFAAVIWLGFGPVYGQGSTQSQLAVDVELKSAGASGNTFNNCQSVTFIFRSSFTGTVGGIAFTSTDVPLTVRAEHGDRLRAVPYVVTAGTLCLIEAH